MIILKKKEQKTSVVSSSTIPTSVVTGPAIYETRAALTDFHGSQPYAEHRDIIVFCCRGLRLKPRFHVYLEYNRPFNM